MSFSTQQILEVCDSSLELHFETHTVKVTLWKMLLSVTLDFNVCFLYMKYLLRLLNTAAFLLLSLYVRV